MDFEGSEAQDVAIDQLVLSPEYQLRERLEPWKVEEYAAVFDRLPPVLVVRLEVGLHLLDGLHRLAAAQFLGRTSVPAKIVETDANAAFVLAIRSNAAHGLPLKTKEKKAAARGMLTRFPERSDRWIAEDVGLSHPTVMGLRAELEAGGKIYHLGYALGQDGKRYPCECSRCRSGRSGQPDQPGSAETARTADVANGVLPTPMGPPWVGPEPDTSDDLDMRVAQGSLSATAGDEPRQAAILSFPGSRDAALSDPEAHYGARLVRPALPSSDEGHALDGRYINADLAVEMSPPLAAAPAPSFPLTIGSVTIRHGDARSLADWQIPEVHLVITSPPYNVGVSYGSHSDELSPEAYFDLLTAVWRACYAVTAPGGRIATIVPFGVGRNPWVPLAARVADLLTEVGFTLRGQIVWDKGTSGGRTTWGSFRLPTDPSLRDTTEAILVGHKGDSHLSLPPGVAGHDSEGSYSPLLADQALFMELAQDHWTVPPESATRVGHPAPFPVALVERLIRFYAYPGAHILDPFAGSGTTGVAALRLGCQATLVDIEASYCCLAEERCRRVLKSGEAYAPAA